MAGPPANRESYQFKSFSGIIGEKGGEMEKKSKGIIVVGIISILNSLLGLSYSLKTFPGFFRSPSLLFLIGWFVGGVGVLRLKKWCRILLVLLSAYSLGYDTGRFIFHWKITLQRFMTANPNWSKQFSSRNLILGFLMANSINLFIWIYLTRPKVKAQFK